MSLGCHAGRCCAIAAVASLLAVTPTSAQTPLTSGSFTEVRFLPTAAGDVVIAFPTTPPYTFTSSTLFYITIVDCCNTGDQYRLFNGSALIGTTTAVPAVGLSPCSSPLTCLADPRLSRGTFLLEPGSYSFNVEIVDRPLFPTLAWIGPNVSSTLAGTPAISAVPEPGSLALFGTGLVVLGGIAARRRRMIP